MGGFHCTECGVSNAPHRGNCSQHHCTSACDRPVHIKERTLYSRDPDERPSVRAWCGYTEDEGRWDNRLSGSFAAEGRKPTCATCIANEAYSDGRAASELED
jgi:hypothetical protein